MHGPSECCICSSSRCSSRLSEAATLRRCCSASVSISPAPSTSNIACVVRTISCRASSTRMSPKRNFPSSPRASRTSCRETFIYRLLFLLLVVLPVVAVFVAVLLVAVLVVGLSSSDRFLNGPAGADLIDGPAGAGLANGPAGAGLATSRPRLGWQPAWAVPAGPCPAGGWMAAAGGGWAETTLTIILPLPTRRPDQGRPAGPPGRVPRTRSLAGPGRAGRPGIAGPSPSRSPGRSRPAGRRWRRVLPFRGCHLGQEGPGGRIRDLLYCARRRLRGAGS